MDERMYESHDSMPWNQSNDLDFDAARAEWERQEEPPERDDTPTFAPGDRVIRRSYRATTIGTVVAVAGSRVRVHWPAVGNRTWVQASALIAATPEVLAERRPVDAEARAARRLTCPHRWYTRQDGSRYCASCRTVEGEE